MTDEEIRVRTLKVISDFQTFIPQKRMGEWGELWHEDGVLEFPFAPNGRQQSYHGKAAVIAQMTSAMSRVQIDKVRYFKVRPLLNPEAAMVEAGTRAHFVENGHQYNQTYVLYFEMREGKIWRYREYWNAITLMDAFGGRDVLDATWGQPDARPRDRPFITE